MIVLLAFLFSHLSFGEVINQKIELSSFNDARQSPNQVKFVVETTKIGLFSSDVDGYVLSFEYQAQLDAQNLILRDLELNFKAASMNTDHEDRDLKLHQKCMEVTKYPDVEVRLAGPIFLKENREIKVLGRVKIRGKEKPFEAFVQIKPDGKNFVILTRSTWSLKEMEIPDPSIAVAKLSDDIRIQTKINIKQL